MEQNSVIQYAVDGMHCGGCVSRVKSTLASFAEQVEVTLTPPQASLTNSRASLAELNEALSAIGNYRLSPITAVAANR